MIPHALSGLPYIERFYTLPTTGSTNDVARTMDHRPKNGIYCIQADRQTSGRGRRGGGYFSNCEGGLWVSLVVPIDDIGDHFAYNRALSLAILLTLAQCGKDLPIKIKWPNDIYWGDKKVCGILLESHPRFSDVLVLGFGLNVNIAMAEFPAELSSIATSVVAETGKRCALTAVLRTILKQFKLILDADRGKVHEAYCTKLFGKGRKIAINNLEGVYESVSEDGMLLLSVGGNIVPVTTGSPVFLSDASSDGTSA